MEGKKNNSIGWDLQQGLTSGVPDPDATIPYYRRGYREGDSLACANLGWCYEVGQGTRKNLPKALEYYREGAELGEEHCMEALERLGME